MKENFGGTTIIDLNMLRDQGFIVQVKEKGAHEHGELCITARNSYSGAALKDEIAHDLELTIGIEKTNKIQEKTAALINRTVLFECIKTATK
jgi:hypothetical protein